LELAPAAETNILPLPPSEQPSAKPKTSLRSAAPGFVMGGVGVAAVVAGVVSLAVFSDKEGQAKALNEQITGAGGDCRGPMAHPRCPKLEGVAGAAGRCRGAGTILLAGGAALAAAGVLYFLWPRKPGNPGGAQAGWIVTASPRGGALVVSGQF